MLRTALIAIAAALLVACASEPAQRAPEKPVAAQVTATGKEAALPERAFPDDSLYELLVAEFALRRREYDAALERYLEQAPLLRDPGVSAHTARLGQYLQREEDTLEAALLWVELEPDNMDARNTAARLLVQSDRSAEAVEHLAAMQRAGQSANFPILLNGFARLDAAGKDRLLADIDALATEFPDNVSVLLTQALAYSEMERYDDALARLERIFQLEPRHTQAVLLEARVLAAQGAEDPYRRVEATLAENPDDTLLRMRYARLLTATDLTAARTQFEILSAQSPRDSDLLFSLALINRELGDPLTAAAYLRQLLDQGQRVDEARYYLGRIEEDKGDIEAALAQYEAVGDGPEYFAARSRAGNLLIESGDLQRAAEWFDRQRAQRPLHGERLLGLEAELLARAGATEQAMALVNEALAEYPDSASLRYTRAMMFEQRDDLAAMEADLRRILADDPDNATALNALGYTLANRTERYQEALALVSRALELEPEEPAILDSMGWVLYRLGRLEEARDYLARAYAGFPDPEVAAHLGEVLWVSGDTEGALRVWRAAVAQNPDHPVLRSTLERLQVGPIEPGTDAEEDPGQGP